ncbi:efflux RND transporter periplasmic adaptor subunit [Algibacillus agarilyticus]|uniref:efflux RND transporter periplasmic adaptor subunit n=1 Tax=Algibacillus agarilyticus TaxID=2234133 RepID=UPI000DD0066B|nr:efflux RND transporter periplasmic adaptor subunit [Algibacillus agarilyticus]
MQFTHIKHILSFSAILFTLTACVEEPTTPSNTLAQAQTATQIDVAQVAAQSVQPWFTYTSRLVASQQVALKPRVSGIIDSIEFVEGQKVKQGDLLFRLDPRPFEAQVARLKAQVDREKATLAQVENEAQRAQHLRKRDAISAEEAEARSTTVKQSQAQLAALNAQLKAAQLNLDFSKIESPINGVISRAEITKGNTVNANISVLTNIVSDHKMYAYFDIDERTWNAHFGQTSAADQLPVAMQLLGNNAFTHTGTVDFIDNKINENTGTLRVRATFLDEANNLRSGAFARIKIASQAPQQQILIPEKAIGTDLKNRFVLVLDETNTLQYRAISLGDQYGQYRAITSGLNNNDVIAINGPAKVGPGMPVSPRATILDLSAVALTLDAQIEQPVLTAMRKD